MSQPITRRQMIQTSAGAALLATSPIFAQEQSLPSQRVTIGIMGLQRGMAVAQAMAGIPGVNIKYVCDVDARRAGAASEKLQRDFDQSSQAVADFRRILDDKEVDALVCAAPNHWHAPATILACNAGKHCYVEKPCSHNPWEGEKMVEAARKHNRAVQMGAQRRSNLGFQEAIQKLHDGIIGRVYASRSWYNNLRGPIELGQEASPPGHLDYELWQGPAPRMPYVENRIHYNWHWFWHWGNGELGNNGVHSLDISRWGLSVDFPKSVASSGGRYRYQDDQQTPDTHVAVYEFEDDKQITWQGHSCNRHSDSKAFVSFYGDDGAMEIDGFGNYEVFDANDKKIDERKVDGDGWSMLDSDHAKDFIRAIREDAPLSLNTEIEKGHKSTLLCHLGNIAYRTQRMLSIDPSNGHILDDEEAMTYWKREYADGWTPKV